MSVSDPPHSLRVEHLGPAALGLGTNRPRLSWVLPAGAGDQVQYTIEIDGRAHQPVSSADSVLVPWPGSALSSRQRVSWRVAVRTDAGESTWSEPAWVEAGLLGEDDWVAAMISPAVPPGSTALLRRAFEVPGEVVRARLYLTALGVVEAELDGRRVGDHVLDPGWTSYGHRLRYRTFDVTGMLGPGPHVLGARVADGWYRGRLGLTGGGGYECVYGDRLGLLAQLEVDLADGTRLVVATDDGWTWHPGPTTRASLYDGEDHDGRAEPNGWSTPGGPSGWWRPVELLEHDRATLVAPTGPPVRVTEVVEPSAVLASPSGRTILDFGQNLVGRVRIDVRGPAGAEVVLRHAEILENDELCTEPLRTAEAKDRYVLGPTDDVETWAPRFTFHGFRYAEVTGPFEGAMAEVCHSDLRRTGWFECSDERINRFHENVVWSMRGNFLDVPTDCPQRDERLGWTGDITVFAPTATFLYDTAGLLRSWLADLAAEQDDDGVPLVVPSAPGRLRLRTAVWGDAAVEVPWCVYEAYGDRDVLEAQYPSMRRWLETVVAHTDPPGHWVEERHLGDWLDPAAPPDDAAGSRTDPDLVANAWFCHTAARMATIAETLGHREDADRFGTIADAAAADFSARYIRPDGSLASDTQTAHALVIHFGLVDDRRRPAVGRRLVELVETNDHRIGTGFVGTPIVCDALCAVGAVDTAYRLLLQTDCPSWLYPVTVGATTVWERWDGIRPDGTRHPDSMNSFNHYALGAVASWLHRSVAGLSPAEPGYRTILVRPRPGPGLDHARAWLDTPYGRAESGWRREGDAVRVHAVIPPGTRAQVELPGGTTTAVGVGDHEWTIRSHDDRGGSPDAS